MGFLSVITGKRKLPAPRRTGCSRSAPRTSRSRRRCRSPPAGSAAIVFQPLATADFESIVRDMEEVVRATARDSGTRVETSDDTYGFRWLVLRGTGFDDLVVGINAVSTATRGRRLRRPRLLCAVFAFRDAQGKRIYWIYNYKRGAFYPFVPAGGEEQRTTSASSCSRRRWPRNSRSSRSWSGGSPSGAYRSDLLVGGDLTRLWVAI